jgi:transcriptional regulator with XRE-family HTH domain
MDVGDRLRQMRERLGMTQGELAAKIGVHETTTVTLWENRKNRRNISSKHIRKVAQVLNIRVSELLGEASAEHAIPEQQPALTTKDNIEYQMLWLFRLMPEKLQLFQLAQFIQCVTGGQGGKPLSQEISIDSAARTSTILGFNS